MSGYSDQVAGKYNLEATESRFLRAVVGDDNITHGGSDVGLLTDTNITIRYA